MEVNIYFFKLGAHSSIDSHFILRFTTFEVTETLTFDLEVIGNLELRILIVVKISIKFGASVSKVFFLL